MSDAAAIASDHPNDQHAEPARAAPGGRRASGGRATRPEGDLTGDGNININDLGELLANFNRVCL